MSERRLPGTKGFDSLAEYRAANWVETQRIISQREPHKLVSPAIEVQAVLGTAEFGVEANLGSIDGAQEGYSV